MRLTRKEKGPIQSQTAQWPNTELGRKNRALQAQAHVISGYYQPQARATQSYSPINDPQRRPRGCLACAMGQKLPNLLSGHRVNKCTKMQVPTYEKLWDPIEARRAQIHHRAPVWRFHARKRGEQSRFLLYRLHFRPA